MKKLSKKFIAVIIAMMMVMTSAPFSAMAATSAPTSDMTALTDAIDAYRAKMNGQNIYTNMSAAYSSYINAVKVYDKAKYGATDVSASDIQSATSDLTTKTNAMVVWEHPTGNARPSSSTKGFSDDSNTITTVNSDPSTYTKGPDWRYIPSGSGNTYVSDVYNTIYQNLAYVQTGVSSTAATWAVSNCNFGIYIPSAVIIYDGSNGFKARVGVMAKYNSDRNKDRKVAQIMVNGNDYVHFGDNWLQCAKDDGDTALSGIKGRYNKLDLIAAIATPSPSDRASGNATPDTTGTRKSDGGLFSGGDTYYIGNYLEFTVPENATAFNTNTATSYSITSIPVQSKSGDTTFNDTWTGNVSVSLQVLNYKLLLNKMNAAKQNLRITAESPYLEGGLSNLITAMNNAANWTPSGNNISTLVSTMNSHISAINNATAVADDQPYGALGTKMEAVLATSGTLGDWYNVNNDTGEYTDASIDAFVTAFTYAQSIFDQNTNFADSYSFSAQSVTVGSGDTAKTVSVPAATKTVQQVYNDLMAAVLVVSERVDVTILVRYIEELTVALNNYTAFGMVYGDPTYSGINTAISRAKYNIWGNTTIEWDDPNDGTHHSETVSNYGNPAKLPKDSAAAQRRVQAQVDTLKPYIDALTIDTTATVTYNDVTAAQNSLARMLSDMADTNLYPRGDYINGDTLDEAINYVNNNFIAAVIPNENTQIVDGIVQAKVNEYKAFLQYCKDIIDALQKTFLALDNGTIIQQGTLEVLTPDPLEDKWGLSFSRYNNVVVFRTTKAKSNLNLGPASLSFSQTDTTAWGSGNEYAAVLDSININDTAGASVSIRKENAISTSELPSVELSAEQCAQYPGGLSMSTTNGGIYGVANFVGVRGKEDGAGGYRFGKNGEDGSLTSAIATTEGTMSAAPGIWAFDGVATLVAGNAYLDLAAESAVNLSRTTTPKSTTYTNTGYFGSVFYWTADGAGVSAIKNVYNGYYHERTTSTYTQTTTVIDISNLKDLVAQMNTLNKADYTEASWNAMKTKLAAATSNDFGSTGTTYRDVTTAQLTSQLTTRYQQLYDAWKALIPAATNIELTRPVAQAQNEGKDIGAVVRANDNLIYTKRQTNNDVTAQNTYGTYTTNTWNDFATAYDAGDVAIFGDGTNAGQYATPTFDTNGNTVVVGTRQYARFKNSDNDPLDLGDLDALGLTIDDMAAIEAAAGVSLSTEQAAINQMAANIRTKYAALKRWANFAPIDNAMAALSSTFASNYDKKYTTASLQAINTAFASAPITTHSYYTIADDAAAQHALRNNAAVYTEDDDAAIAAEAAAITAALPPVESNVNQDNYTAEAVIALVDEGVTDPDAKDATVARQEAQALSQTLFTTVNIAPLANKAVIGVNYVENSEIDQQIATILSHIENITYDVTVKNGKGNVIATYTDQPYGTSLSIASTSGEAVEWVYTYESRTVKNHTPTRTGSMATFDFVVVGDTTIIEGEPYESGTAANGFKVVFNDNLNHVYAVEYVNAGATITYGEDSVIITDGGETKEITPPSYAFYEFTSFAKASSTPVAITKDTVVTAEYEASEDEDNAFTFTVYNASTGKSGQFDLCYNDKITIDPALLPATRVKTKNYPGKYYLNGEEQDLTIDASVTRGKTLFKMTYLEDTDFDEWSALRDEFDTSVYGTEIPFEENVNGEYNLFADGDIILVLYEEDTDYYSDPDEEIVNDFIASGPYATVRSSVVVSNEKFTMHGKEFLPDGYKIVECGILAYLGNREITADELVLANMETLKAEGALRGKSSTYSNYGNINISIRRNPNNAKSRRVRYRTYLVYKNETTGQTGTVYSAMADDTQLM